jgi:LuxR family transcriptional regulator, maltose regulon positive regulatory protein
LISVATAADVTPGPLLVESKLQPPRRRELVPRPQLVTRLAAGQPRRLTVISAPAGWGKTSLLAAWAVADGRPFAWLSLDARDGEGRRFWTYLVAAIRTVEPGFGLASLELLTAPGVSMEHEALPVLVNELAALPVPIVVALDDYHLVDSTDLQSEMGFLIEHLPETCELAMTTRAEPRLPLARMRARRELHEIDASQLRFSRQETGELLNGLLSLDLPDRQINALHWRTEGWAAGLYLAGLSVAHQDDASRFIDEFAGDDRQIVDYLGSEVLSGVPDEVREFLVRTSILDRLSVPLCEALMESTVASRLLPDLERSNLFLVPLDDRREWYRYHHLFGDLLRRELERTHPGLRPELHRRAAAWFLSAGDADQAIRHTIAAGDSKRAAQLVADHWTPWLLERGEHGDIGAWLGALGDEVVRSDARLCVARVFVGHSTGRMHGLEQWLAAADRALGSNPDPRVRTDVAAAHSSHRILTGDVGGAIEVATPAIEGGDRGSLWYPVPFGARAHARRWSVNDEGARADFHGYMRESAERNQFLSVISSTGSLALLDAEAGRWRESEARAARALEMTQHALSEHWMMGNTHTALALVHAHRGDRAAALKAGERAAELVRRGGVPGDRANTLLTVASLQAEADDEEAASALLGEAREIIEPCRNPGPVIVARLERTERSLRRASLTRQPTRGEPPELSERELAVLRLLASPLSQREIGSELYVSLNTVKTHTRHIFRKLGVSSRDDATERARVLGLLS